MGLTTQELVERLRTSCTLNDTDEAADRLSEMDAAIRKIEDHLSDYIETHKTVDVSIAVAYETARAALEHQQKGETP